MKQTQSKGNEIPHKLFFRLYQVLNLSLRKATQVLREVGMSPQQWSILDSLSRPDLAEGMTVNGLVAYLMVSRQSLNGVLKRMEEAGYIERVVNPEDSRSRMVRLTSRGREVWESAGAQVKLFYDDSLKHMTEQEKLDGIASLDQILANVKKF
tara:strand:+ start:44 stop:502 length:459 start_codon:yes stop_codon:yes gene_type:complete